MVEEVQDQGSLAAWKKRAWIGRLRDFAIERYSAYYFLFHFYPFWGSTLLVISNIGTILLSLINHFRANILESHFF